MTLQSRREPLAPIYRESPADPYIRPYSPRVLRRFVRVEKGVIVMRCDSCFAKSHGGPSYWPLTEEFWMLSRGLAKCRACHREDNSRRKAYWRAHAGDRRMNHRDAALASWERRRRAAAQK